VSVLHILRLIEALTSLFAVLSDLFDLARQRWPHISAWL